MTSIKISNPYSIGSISVSNTFIDLFMPPANGEFVKVYLYLLRAANSGYSPTIPDMADALSHTESDILRALKYWENQGLFALIFDNDGELATISLLPVERSASIPVRKPANPIKTTIRTDKNTLTFAVSEPKPSASVVKMPPAKPNYDPRTIAKAAEDNDEIANLIYEAETLLNATVSERVISTLYYLYDELNFPGDLICFMIEYCAERGKKNFKYFEKMALSWYEKGISSVDDARQMLENNSGAITAVKNALGLSTWGEEARASLQVWTNDYNMPIELIVEGCNRAYTATGGKNALKYVQKIIEDWNSKDIRSLDELRVNDKAFHSNRKQTARASLSPAKKAFHNYEKNEGIDYDALLAGIDDSSEN